MWPLNFLRLLLINIYLFWNVFQFHGFLFIRPLFSQFEREERGILFHACVLCLALFAALTHLGRRRSKLGTSISGKGAMAIMILPNSALLLW